jgi:uncharacterized protein
MIHQYKLNGYNLVLDVYSGSVHVVDELAYDAVEMLDAGKSRAETAAELQKKYAGRPEGAAAEVADCLDSLDELKSQGRLFSPDRYESHAFDFKNRSTVVKALCLHVAHTCNLDCSYCFAAQGKFHGKAGLMSYETGKQALDYLIANSGTRRIWRSISSAANRCSILKSASSLSPTRAALKRSTTRISASR